MTLSGSNRAGETELEPASPRRPSRHPSEVPGDTSAICIYGQPSESALRQLHDMPRLMGSGTVSITVRTPASRASTLPGRSVTLTGAGGVGKTRLAFEVAFAQALGVTPHAA
jgi:hypothetical protein